MKKTITRKLFSSILFMLFLSGIFAQKSNPWTSIKEESISKSTNQRNIIPSKYKTFKLDLSALRPILSNAPERFSQAARNAPATLMLPMPDGSFQRFEVVEAPVMHPDLQAKYPFMRSFAGKGIDDPTAYLRFSVTQKGFNGMILSSRSGTIYIDPYKKGDTENYICYYKKDFVPNQSHTFSCGVDTPEPDFIEKN